MSVYVIEEVLLDEGTPFENKVLEVWAEKDKAWSRYDELNKQYNKEGISYTLEVFEVKE